VRTVTFRPSSTAPSTAVTPESQFGHAAASSSTDQTTSGGAWMVAVDS
jgi:hypothetical protein